jgi:hypothetical protein
LLLIIVRARGAGEELRIAAIRSSPLSLFHELDVAMMILIWNLGAAALNTALGGVFGRRTFLWWSGGSGDGLASRRYSVESEPASASESAFEKRIVS